MLYADYNGSAPLLTPVKEYLTKRLESQLFANPNAIHSKGQKIHQGLERCRAVVGEILGAYPDQIIFTSGASEGISTVFHSVLSQAKNKKLIYLSPIEHVAVLETASHYEKNGFELAWMPVNDQGVVSFEAVKTFIEQNSSQLALVCLMAANNETGALQPYLEVAQVCSKYELEFLSDTTQLIGKGDFHFEKSLVSYAVASSHKLGALPGSGLLLVKDSQKLAPLIFGGGQEKDLRGGTQNYLAIETLAIALSHFAENKHQLLKLKEAREHFETQMKKDFPDICIIAEKAERLSGTTLISLPGLHGQAVQIELESLNIFVTTSAACSDNEPETSKVLKAMGIDDRIGRGVIRISLSYSHGKNEYSLLEQGLKSAYNKLYKIHSY